MHELSIAQQIVPPLLKAAEENRAQRVRRVHLLLGEAMLIVPHALRQALVAVTEDTIAADADWHFTEVPTTIRCNRCSNEFNPEMGNYICPECGVADGEIVAGNDILIDAVDLDVEE